MWNSWETSETPWEIRTCEIWYTFHTAEFGLGERATVWMDSVWVCVCVCVHALDTKNKLLNLWLRSLETVYWKNFWKTTTSQLPGKLGNDIAWTSAVKYAWESHKMWKINICKYLRITKQHNKSNRTPGQSRGSSRHSWNRWSSCFRL